jgi:diguanylate cyclase (GGDEF)-like protein
MIPNLVPLSAAMAFDRHGQGLRLLPVMIMLYVTVLSIMALHEFRSRRDNIVLRLQVAEMALFDSLTRLRNRRYLQEFMTGEVDRILRDWSGRNSARRRLWVMMLDLDHFKRVNDEHGHDAGDAVLRQLADVLRDTVRRGDVVARWGGEEFVVVARDADGAAGGALAERIRENVAGHRFELPGGGKLQLTCSIGYAIYPFWDAQPQALRWDDVLGVADTALYRAKQHGRNRAVGIVGAEAQEPASVEQIRADVDRASMAGLVRVEQQVA